MTHTTTQTNTAILGAAFMIGAGVIFAMVNILVQSLTMQIGLAASTAAFWQYFIALLFSLPWIFNRVSAAFKTSQLMVHIIRVALAAGGVQLWVFGLSSVPIWQAIALLMTSPFFVTIGARLFLGEEVSLDRWFAVAFGFAGGMVILAPWSDAFTVTMLYPIGAALLWALSSLVTKYLAKSEGADTLTLYLLLLLTPINGFLAVQSGFGLPTGTGLWIILGAGILTAAAQFFLASAYRVADAAYLQPFDHLKLPANVILGWLAFGFLPTGSMWIGTAMILLASLFLLSRESRT